MDSRRRFRCGLVAGASLLAVAARAVSAANDYVEVGSSTTGVVEVVTVGLDFHITTTNVPDAFVADVEVEATSGWRLLSPNPASFKMSVGEKRGYEVCNENNEEDKAGGDILLFKVDVEIDGVGEDKEVTEGAFVGYADCANGFDPACVAAMKPVRIRCLPANRPDGERIVLTFPPGHLLEKIGTTYQAAQSSYKANEIGGKSFWLHGHEPSWAERDRVILAEHNINGCKDEAKFSVVSAGFTVESDYPHHSGPVLTDNREATVRIFVTGIDDPGNHSFQLTAKPVETGSLINKGGTSITFTPTDNPLVWRTSTVYWYGKLPGQCCYKNRFAYEFTLAVDTDLCVVSNRCTVGWPDENPNATCFVAEDSDTVVHEPEPVPGITNYYRCLIEFGGFLKVACYAGLPTCQYCEEIDREEEYHVKQWLGQVSTDEGGLGDCFSAKGVAWMANCIGDGPWYTYASTPEEARERAIEMVEQAEQAELSLSTSIKDNDRGFRELKAKAHAGYNAAFMYHCVYEHDPDYGANPVNHRHPAY